VGNENEEKPSHVLEDWKRGALKKVQLMSSTQGGHEAKARCVIISDEVGGGGS